MGTASKGIVGEVLCRDKKVRPKMSTRRGLSSFPRSGLYTSRKKDPEPYRIAPHPLCGVCGNVMSFRAKKLQPVQLDGGKPTFVHKSCFAVVQRKIAETAKEVVNS